MIYRNIAHIRKIITLMVAIQKTENSIQCLRRIFPWIFKDEKECEDQVQNNINFIKLIYFLIDLHGPKKLGLRL